MFFLVRHSLIIKAFDLDIIETDLSDSALTDQQIVVEVLVCLVEQRLF